MSERKYPLTEYGKKIKTELLKIDKTQEWLIDELKLKLPDRFVDCSILNKVLTGRVNSQTIIAAIDEILEGREEE